MPDDEDLDEVVRRERQLLDPSLRSSGPRVRELLHPEFVEHGASGRVWEREAIAAALEADPGIDGEAIDFHPVKLADSVVLLTYRIVGDSGSVRSSVWVKESGARWLLRFHQGTRCLPHP